MINADRDTTWKCHEQHHLLTSLVSSNGDGRHRPGEWAELRDSVQRLNLEGVVGMSDEVQYSHRGVGQAHMSGDEAYAFSTQLTVPGLSPALLTHHVVGKILPASHVTGRAPL